MDLSYGPELDALRAEVRGFLSEHWPAKGDEAKLPQLEREQRFRERAIAARLPLPRHPEASTAAPSSRPMCSGAGDPRGVRGARARRGRCAGIGPMMLVPTLLERGAEWQKEKFVRDDAAGEIDWCQGYSEPGSGSDLASLQDARASSSATSG